MENNDTDLFHISAISTIGALTMNQKFREDDQSFLERVSEIIRPELRSTGFKAYPWPKPLRHNTGLKIERVGPIAWEVGGTPTTIKKVGIHFEGVIQGSLQLDIEVTPYETGIDEFRLQQLAHQNVPKAQVMEELRTYLLGNAELCRHFEVKRGRYSHSYPPACEAVRFIMQPSEIVASNEYAKFCLDVVRHVAPLVDTWLDTNRQRWMSHMG
jgi:hypothetical protein